MKRFLYMIAMLAFLSCEPIDDMDSIEVLSEPKPIEIVKTLTVSPTTFEVEAEGGSMTSKIISNCDWKVSKDATWFTLSASAGSNDYSLVMTVDENTSEESRTAKVTIQYDSKSVTITITQKGKEKRNPDGDDNVPPSW